MFNRVAARVKFNSSATATKYLRCRSSTWERLDGDAKNRNLGRWSQRGPRALSMSDKIPSTMADSAHPGCSREDSTSNVCLPKEASSGM